jgi:hypothetical protein
MSLGALIALRSDLATAERGAYWWMHFGRAISGRPAKRSVVDREQRFQIASGDHIHYCLRVETISDTQSRYSAKLWPDGETEPSDWQMQSVDRSEAFTSGSVIFVVHHSDVTLCRVRVESLDADRDSHP